MWTRLDLKRRAKECVRANYWPLVLVSFLQLLIFGISSSSRFEVNISDSGTQLRAIGVTLYSSTTVPIWAEAAAVFASVMGLIFLLISILLLAPLEVGCCRYFLISMDTRPAFSCILGNFDHGYWNTVITMLLRRVYNFFWFFLFIIPGFIKLYEYRMIPYLLAEYPDMARRDAFRISRDLMYGHKWDAFILDLSFLGWHILRCITCHLVGIFYANPYQNMTNAHLYRALCVASRQTSEPQTDEP